MRNVEIYINGNRVDYAEAKSIPLSLRRRTDKFLEIVGADGSEVDNALRSLTLPPTTTNQKHLLSLIANSALGRGSTRVAVQCIVNGIQLFAGSGILKTAKKVSNSTPYYTLELLGDGLSLWEKLESVVLTDMVIGSTQWSFANILANWADETLVAYNAYWCPVVYGTERGNGTFSIKDFRPSVRFAPVVKAIFNQADYTLHSDFFETQFFQRHAFVFGVGKAWAIAGDYWKSAKMKANYGAQIAHTNGLVSGIYMVYEPTFDPLTMYNSNNEPPLLTGPPGFEGFINPAFVNYTKILYNGIYKIKITVNSEDEIDNLNLKVLRPSTPSVVYDKSSFVGVSDAGSNGVSVEYSLELKADDQIHIFLLTTISGGGFEIHVRSVSLTVTMLGEPFIGSFVGIASCLPPSPAKDLLRGISHMFDLGWRVDETTKTVFCEPRFDYTLIEAGEPVTRKGFYRRDYPMETVQIDAEEVSVEYATPFGNAMKIGYKTGNDPMEKELLKEMVVSGAKIAPYFADITLHDRGRYGEVSANPYFTGLYQSKPESIRLRESAYLPTILPSGFKRGDKLPGYTWTPPGGDEKTESPPTYEGEPKCGIIFPKALSFEFYYDDSDTTYFSEGVRAPWITQQKWNDVGGTDALSDYDSASAYADLLSKDAGRVIRGLVSTFYPNYISVVKEGQVLSGRIIISLPKFTAIDFRRMWGLKYDSNDSIWILLELTNFRALVASDCQGKFIKYVSPKQADMDDVSHDDPDVDPITPDIQAVTE